MSRTLGGKRIAGRDRKLPHRQYDEKIRISPKLAASTLAPDRRNWEDEDEGDYMDMTPKSTPARSNSKLSRSQTVDDFGPRTPDLNSSYTSLFEESDYADMTGKKSPNHLQNNLLTLPGRTSPSIHNRSPENSPLRFRSQTERSPSPLSISPRQRSNTEKSPTPAVPSPTQTFDLATSPKLKTRSAFSLQQRNDKKSSQFLYDLDSPHRQPLSNSASPNRLHLTLARSPNQNPFEDRHSPFHEKPSLYLEGSFDKDDQDDYELMPSLKSLAIQKPASKIKQPTGAENKTTNHRTLNRMAQRTLPPVPNLSKPSSPRSPRIDRSRSKSARYPSHHDTNNNNTFGSAASPMRNRTNTLSSSRMQPHSAENLTPYKRNISSEASMRIGRTSPRYLDPKDSFTKQQQEQKPRSHSAEIQRSPSRTSRTGVQNRINRLRHNQSFNQAARPRVYGDRAQGFVAKLTELDDPYKHRNVSETASKTNALVDQPVNPTDRKKAQPLGTGLRRSRSFQSLVGKGSDGSQVMKCIVESQGNRSPDSAYLEWFTKTTPYSTRKSSNTSMSDSQSSMNPTPATSPISFAPKEVIANFATNDLDDKTEPIVDLTIFETPSTPIPDVNLPGAHSPGISKKRKSFWRRRRRKSKQKNKEKEVLDKSVKPSADAKTKIKKSRKSWKFKYGRKRSSASSVQNETEKQGTKSYPINYSPKLDIRPIALSHEDKKANRSVENNSPSCSLPSPTSPSSTSVFDFKNPQHLEVKLKPDSSENNLNASFSSSQLQSSNNKNVTDKLIQNFDEEISEQQDLVKEPEDEAISEVTANHPELKHLRSIPSLDISLASNYDDNAFLDQGQSQSKKRFYDSIKSRSLGRLFIKKGLEKKSLDGGSVSCKSEEKLSEADFDSLLNVTENSTPQIDKNNELTNANALENEEDSLTVLEINSGMMAHGFVMQNSLGNVEKRATLQNEKKKRRTSSGRRKDYHLSIYSSIKRLGSRSSELDDIDPAATTCSVADGKDANPHEDEVDQLDAKKCASNESLFDSEPTTLANSRPKIRPIYQKPSTRALDVARLLLHCIKTSQPELICGYEEIEEDSHCLLLDTGDCQPDIDELLRRSYAKGHDLVTWTQELLGVKQKLVEKSDVRYKTSLTPTRRHIAGMWQVLFEEGAIFHVKCEEQFEDGGYYYGFHEEVTTPHLFPNSFARSMENNDSQFSYEKVRNEHSKTVQTMTKLMLHWLEELNLSDAISFLHKQYHDAMFRKALRQQPEKRTTAELKMIYEEILHIKALAPLSDSIKRELAGVLKFEFHQEPGATLFRQGDEGTSWYIILHGSVKVDVLGKGIVCSLHEGDDFGNLALVNDAPRSATIIAAEANCHFMKVDKVDFVRILKDVEANTVRLKEHDQDVLILEKIRSTSKAQYEKSDSTGDIDAVSGQTKQSYRYVVTAGTPQRILEHILEYIQPWRSSAYDEAMEDFILMHSVFMKTVEMFEHLLKNYRAEDALSASFEMKRKIIYFVVRWSHIVGDLREEDEGAYQFLQELMEEVDFDCIENSKYEELKTELSKMYSTKTRSESVTNNNDTKSGSYLIIEESVKRYETGKGLVELQRPIRGSDEALLKVYNCEKEYATVKLPVSASADEILKAVAEKMNKHSEDVVQLYEIQESGEIIAISKYRRSVVTSINLNSVLSMCDEKEDHSGIEYVHKVFGPKKFPTATPNLDVLTRRFNQLTYWPPTEICSCSNAHKRGLILRKFIKIAQHLKMYQNMFAFMAIVIGIGNQAVSRLSSTWEKLPAKYRKLMQEFETILDPSRNHRKYRVLASSLQPPFIPYFPLLMKDMTFQHEGNDNQKQSLVNFEKMHMLSNSIKTIITGCSEKIDGDNLVSSTKTAEETRNYVKNFRVITNQKTLNELSAQIESKR